MTSTKTPKRNNAQQTWNIRKATSDEAHQWNDVNKTTIFTQTPAFAAVKGRFGWTPHLLLATCGDETLLIVVLQKNIPLLGALWYVPCGPTPRSIDQYDALLASLSAYAAKSKVFLVKVEPRYKKLEQSTSPDLSDAPESSVLSALRAIKSLQPQPPVQPPSTLYVEVSSDEDYHLLGRRARRYARKGKAEGVIVKEVPVTPDHCKTMYGLMQTANGGKGVPGQQTYHYYETFWREFAEAGLGSLFFAYEDDAVVAGAYVIKNGDVALYKDGGSTAKRSSQGAAYYLHAEIMRTYAKRGCTQYDMWGMPPADQIDDKSHPFYGIGQFKLAFAKDITDYVGCYDYIIDAKRAKVWHRIGYSLAVRANHWLGRGNFW